MATPSLSGSQLSAKDIQKYVLLNPRWAIPNLAARGHLSLLYGAAGSGKSTLYQEAVVANSLGRPFMELVPFEEPQRFLIYDWENGPDMFSRAMQRLGLDEGAEAKDNFIYYFDPSEAGLATEAGREAVRFDAEVHGATCIVFDALLDAFRGVPPTDEDAIGVAMQETKAIALDLQVAILVVAHSPKAGYEDGLNMLKGNAAWGQKSDQMFWFHRDKKSELRKLEHAKARAMSRRSPLEVQLIEEGDPDVGSMHVVGRTPLAAAEVRAAKSADIDTRVKAHLAEHGPLRWGAMEAGLKEVGIGKGALGSALRRISAAGELDRPEGERGPYGLRV